MPRNFLLLISLVLIILSFGSCSSFYYKNAAESKLTSLQYELEPDPLLIHGILENGFRYYLYENSRPENRVDIHLDVLAGSMNEMENQRGLAHYLEHIKKA